MQPRLMFGGLGFRITLVFDPLTTCISYTVTGKALLHIAEIPCSRDLVDALMVLFKITTCLILVLGGFILLPSKVRGTRVELSNVICEWIFAVLGSVRILSVVPTDES